MEKDTKNWLLLIGTALVGIIIYILWLYNKTKTNSTTGLAETDPNAITNPLGSFDSREERVAFLPVSTQTTTKTAISTEAPVNALITSSRTVPVSSLTPVLKLR